MRVPGKKTHLAEIAWIELPTDWARCEVLWQGMGLTVHSHGYPHAMHIFCGHREWGGGCPPLPPPFPSRDFMLMVVKDLYVCGVSMPAPVFVL